MNQTDPHDERVLDSTEAPSADLAGDDLQPGHGGRTGAGRGADRDARLNLVKTARAALVLAREGYVDAVTEAYDAGISPTIIAGAAGVTEAAVRQTVKRNR